MSAPPVVAVVLNWNLPDDTVRCVRSLLAGRYDGLRVVVVDNGSSDNSLEVFRRELPTAEVVDTGANRFYAGGINVGIERALALGAKWVLLLNNDTVASPDMVQQLVQAGQNSTTALVAPSVYRLDAPERLWDAGTHWPRWRPLPRRARLEAGPYAVDMVTGCAMLLRAEALRNSGVFDERYVMYYEDADLCTRLRRMGWGIVVAPAARLWHAVGKSAALAGARSAEQRAHYRLRFYRQHARWPWRAGTLLAVSLHVLWQALRLALRGERILAHATLCGLRTGWREPIEGSA